VGGDGVAGEGVFEMAAAHGDVAVVAADLDLGAVAHGVAGGVDAEVHRGLAAAVADRFQLGEIVGEREERGAAGEEVALKIGAQAVAEHGDFEGVGDIGGLPHLVGGEELGFVDEDAGDGAWRRVRRARG
jgi:hypothetical protein